MENKANPTQIMDELTELGPGEPEPGAVLSDFDRRYQFTAPDDPPRYGLIVLVAGALISLILLTVVIANVTDSSGDTDADETLAGPNATTAQQVEQPTASSINSAPFDADQNNQDENNDAAMGEFSESEDGDAENSDSDDSDSEDSDSDGESAGAEFTGPTVPSLLGKPQADSGAILTSLGIDFSIVEKPSETFTKGTVISTAPEAGQSIKSGDTLTVYISSGPTKLVVPDVIGIEAAIAVARLTDAGMASALVDTPNATAEAGVVIASDPSVGKEVAEGTVVKLSVSTGTSEAVCVTVPNVVGQKAPIATGLMAQAGLVVTTKDVAHSAAVNTVVNSSPTAGQCVDPGSAATIGVSCASDIVPNVVGLPVDVLSVAGFTVEKLPEQTNSVPAGTVLATTPKAGTKHCQSVPVQARVASGSVEAVCDVAVPNLIGLSGPQATAQAAALGLSLKQTLAPNPLVAEGLIVASDPSANAVVCSGTAVTVTVSSGPGITELEVPNPADCTIAVPPVALKPGAEVKATLEALGLVASIFNRTHDAVPPGFVSGWTADRPVSNGEFCPGDRIFVTVSTGQR